MDYLSLIGRTSVLFSSDVGSNEARLYEQVSAGRFLVIGGAGSIGQAVTKEIFKRNPKALHVVDISENNMVELVRDIRSTLGYIEGDFRIPKSIASRRLPVEEVEVLLKDKKIGPLDNFMSKAGKPFSAILE